MGQVKVSINDRSYAVSCGDGEEDHVRELAAYVNRHVASLADEVGQVGEARLLLMASLLISDELSRSHAEEPDAGRGNRKADRRPGLGGGAQLPVGKRHCRGAGRRGAAHRGAVQAYRGCVKAPLPPCLCLTRSPSGQIRMDAGAAWFVRTNLSRGLTLLKGAVPGEDRGLLHTAPTYLCRSPRKHSSTAKAAPLFLLSPCRPDEASS